MKHTLHLALLSLALLLALNSCSHNNGDIGPWFGLWHLESIDVDGTEQADYEGDFFFMFQGKVFGIKHLDVKNHLMGECYATLDIAADNSSVTVNFVDDRYSMEDNFPNVLMQNQATLAANFHDGNLLTLTYFNTSLNAHVTYQLKHWE